MGRGSYRGGGNLLGWNANRYVAPSLTGRTRGGKALIRDLTARTAQSRAELDAQDERARKRHGLGPGKGQMVSRAGATAASTGATGVAEAARKRLKAGAGQAFSVTVVRKKRRKGKG
ncbi:MAG: hypothetical protein JNL41_21955 [Phenylobacterium sp.]|uniref:hypothetical protein n=1 Tax=Phenylobacterium sp. TaxID=1871053 RepID=UPI001A4BB0A4|nr:hypothetical protein [Phenylobacterium sp.]MBL8556952.1 hypothetical protein [Phenylobacterium sp.]